jgi:hypothetical protein
LSFATSGLQQPGYIFYGYVITLGRKAIPFQEYAEETRELNIYTSYLRFHEEGELVAKIQIPSHRLERVVRWDSNMLTQLESGVKPTPAPPYPKVNSNYTPPEQYSNIRELLFAPEAMSDGEVLRP